MTTECIAVIGAIATVFAGFGGAALGACFAYKTGMKLVQTTHKNDIALMQKQGFNEAAAQFRNAFLGTILFLRDNIRIKGTGTSNKINEFLGTLIFTHMEALARFEPFLSANDRKRMSRVWDEYCHPKDIPQNPNEKGDFRFNDYMSIEDTEGTNKAKEIALQKIHKILELADVR